MYEPEYVPRPAAIDTSAPLDIQRADDGTWLIEGPWLQRLMGNVNFSDYESRMWFDKMLREANPDYDKCSDIKWNFTKFLIDRDGKVVARFEPTADMATVEQAVADLL